MRDGGTGGIKNSHLATFLRRLAPSTPRDGDESHAVQGSFPRLARIPRTLRFARMGELRRNYTASPPCNPY